MPREQDSIVTVTYTYRCCVLKSIVEEVKSRGGRHAAHLYIKLDELRRDADNLLRALPDAAARTAVSDLCDLTRVMDNLLRSVTDTRDEKWRDHFRMELAAMGYDWEALGL